MPGFATDEANPDWPCVQRKVSKLSVSQVWDGPSIEGVNGWWSDAEVMKLVNLLAARRTSQEEAEKAVKAFADAQPEDKRNERLTLVFAGVFDKVSGERRTVIAGIERYNKAQEERSERVQKMGTEIAELEETAATDKDAAEKLKKAEEDYEWAARIFQERQNNIPIACEVPVFIDQHLYQMAQLIRSAMSS